MKKLIMIAAVIAMGSGMLAPMLVQAQCPAEQLDHDFVLGTLEIILGRFFVDGNTGENLWTGDMGSTPLWTQVPGQDGPSFRGGDNDDNGINDDDQLDMLAAVYNGAMGDVLGALNPADVMAVRDAYDANRDYVQTVEITLRDVKAKASIIGTIERNITTGGSIDFAGQEIDIPSLWTGEDALLESAGAVLHDALLSLIAGYGTMGDAESIAYLQEFLRVVINSIIYSLLPSMLNDMGGDIIIETFTINASTGDMYAKACGIPVVDCAELWVKGSEVTRTVNDFATAFSCDKFATAGGGCMSAILGASGNLNGDGQTNLQSYQASADRQAFLQAESIANPPLQITENPADYSARTGDQVAFSMDYVGGSGMGASYQWNAVDDEEYTPLEEDDVPLPPVALTQDFEIEYVIPDDANTYIGRVCDPYWTRKTLPAALNVTTINFQWRQPPVDSAAGNGNDFVFVARVKGGVVVPTYQWLKNNGSGWVEITDGGHISGANSPELTFSPISFADAGTYMFRAYSEGATPDTLQSDPVELMVLEPIIIDAQPSGANMVVGESHTLSVTASGGGTAGAGPLSYQWTRDAVNIPGATSSSYSIAPAAVANQGAYQCKITDPYGQLLLSNSVDITVLGVSDQSPINQTVPVGSDFALFVNPEGGVDGSIPGDPLLYDYTWSKYEGDLWIELLEEGNTLYFSAATLADSALYRCMISDGAPRTLTLNMNVKVSNKPIVVTTQPSPAGVLVGLVATLNVAATGGESEDASGAHLAFTWLRDGTPINVSDPDVTVTSTDSNSTLTIVNAEVADQGQYTCRINDQVVTAMVQDSEAADVYVGEPLTFAPGAGPVGGDFHIGASHVLEVSAGNGVGPITYEWYQSVNGGTPVHVGPNAPTLDITPATPLDSGTYFCKIYDVGLSTPTGFVPTGSGAYAVSGVYVSDEVQIRVGAPLQLFAAGQPQNVVAGAGDDVSFTVAPLGGLGTLNYQWYDASKGAIDPLVNPSAATATLVLENVGAADAGAYHCEIEDEIGDAQGAVMSASATLTLTAALQITTQPADVDASVGETRSIGVAATGGSTGSYTYQWYKGDPAGSSTAVTDATTAVLTFTEIAVNGSGSYFCEVRDGASTVRSEAATVLAQYGVPVAGTAGLAMVALLSALTGMGALRRKK